MFEVVEPGFQTTVQDVGRKEGQSMGIPPSGAQDTFALRVANLLVGNPTGGPLMLRDDPGAAGLEVLLSGLKLRALGEHVVALTGADMAATLDGEPAPHWEAFVMREGQVLALSMAKTGVRGYLAVHGGIDVPMRMGSRATHQGGRFGGLNGRKLEAGDRIPVGAPSTDADRLIGRRYDRAMRPEYRAPWEIRVVSGPEAHHFTDESRDAFYGTEWKLNPKADRIGMRFIGPQLEFKPGRPSYLVEEAGADPSNIVIDPGAPVGTIQVPSGVEPIVLAVDSPTIGGFARIACVISLDMARLAQIRALEPVRFVQVTAEDAAGFIKQQEEKIQESHVHRGN